MMRKATALALAGTLLIGASGSIAQQKAARGKASAAAKLTRPKLVVMLVVDQMRADYVDKFRSQWTGGLKRLVEEGAWFREAAYPYSATETCVGHSTISTGAIPATHGMVSNEWWDRTTQDETTCTADTKAKNVAYGGATVKGGDSAWKMKVPAFADELKYQLGSDTRVVTFSLKARAAITLAGNGGNAVTWFDGKSGSWLTSSAFPVSEFVDEYAKAHPVSADYGKVWEPMLPAKSYWYEEKAVGAVPPANFGDMLPHKLAGAADSKEADSTFYSQWGTSPFADTYLAQMAFAAVQKMGLGKGPGTDYLGVSFSSVDYVGHAFGAHSREMQDILAQLDRDLGDFFTKLDKEVGKGNYVVALSADHGGAPVVEDLQRSGIDTGWLSVPQIKERIEKALDRFNYKKPTVAEVEGSEVIFSPGTYDRIKSDPTAYKAVMDAIQSVPGVARVFTAEELVDRLSTPDRILAAEEASYFKGRSGDLFVVPKPYWVWDFAEPGKPRGYAGMHGTPYFYDQRVPILFMGWGIQHGEYFGAVTPADIAPTFGALCGVTLATRDGRALGEAIAKPSK